MKAQREDYTRYFQVGLLLVVVSLVGLTLYAVSENERLVMAAEEYNTERVHRGETIYAQQCQACHGAEGEGGVGPALNSKKLLDNTPDNVFFSVVRSGVPNTQMPAWSVDYGGPLTDEDVRDTVAFVRSWQASAPEIVEAKFVPDPAQGAVLFASTCAICHGEDGSGTDRAPKLNDAGRLSALPDEWYRSTIQNGRPAKGMPTWGTVLSPEQIDDLVALISVWREGGTVTPSFSIGELLDQVIFALQNGDGASAELNIGRALKIASGPGANALETAQDQIASNDLISAESTLEELRAQWPLGDPANGALVYTARCAACHGIQGEGGVGLVLNPSEFIQSSSNAEMVDFIRNGRPGTLMTGFKDLLKDAEIADVVAFLRLWQK